mgnify:CR=1 FL=1
MPTQTYYINELPAVVEDVTYIPVFVVNGPSNPPSTDNPPSEDPSTPSQSEQIICPANKYVSSSTAGLTKTSECGKGLTGTMTWTCGKDGKWTNNKDSVCKKSTIIDGFPDNYIYYGGAAIFALLAILMI